MSDWNPQQYLKFKNERTQPSIDLVAKIRVDSPKKIIDIGCGPGNSTQPLLSRWPKSHIVGLDSSPKMIEQAKKDFPEQKWILGDANNIDTKEKYDIVFSNAAIQFLPDQERTIPKFFSIVNENGAMAVQTPEFDTMPIGRSLKKVADSKKWKEHTAGSGDVFYFHNENFYYEILSPLAKSIEIWETSYVHVLNSHKDLIEWTNSTALRPYLDKLPNEEDKISFQNELLELLKKDYPTQKDGKVLFPFKRLFFVAYK
jgi:trans-aconitate 2-methyltransferase